MRPRLTSTTHLAHSARASGYGELDVTIRDDLTVANEHKREPAGGSWTSSVNGDSTYECVHSSYVKSIFNSVCTTPSNFPRITRNKFQ